MFRQQPIMATMTPAPAGHAAVTPESSSSASFGGALPTKAANALARLLLALGLLLLAAEAAVFCLFGTSVYDEGGYLYEGWLTVSQGWLPFRDFYAKVPPLLYYLYGVGQALGGHTILVGRLEATLFLFLTVFLAARMARQFGGRWAAVLVVWLPATAPATLNSYCHAYATAPTGFCMMLAVYLLTVPRPSLKALFGGGISATAILLCRHDLLPFVLILWLYMLLAYPASRKQKIAAVFTSLAAFGLILLPFMLQAPQAALWSLSSGKVGGIVTGPDGYGVAEHASMHAIAWHVMVFLRQYAGALLLLLPGLAYCLGSRGDRPWRAEGLQPLWLPLIASLVNWLSHAPAAALLKQNVFYILDQYIYFPVAVVTAVLFAVAARRIAARDVKAAWFVAVVAGLALVFTPVLTGPGPLLEFSLAKPTALEQIRKGAEVLRRNVQPQDIIFTIDDPQQFLEAGLVLPDSLTHSLFSYRASPDTEALRRVHFFNDQMIGEWLGGKATVVVMSGGAEDWMINSGRYAGGQRLGDFISAYLEANYKLVAEVPGTHAGPLRIYRWKTNHILTAPHQS